MFVLFGHSRTIRVRRSDSWRLAFPTLPVDVERLVSDPQDYVRIALASNAAAAQGPERARLMEMLADDASWSVRYRSAGNPSPDLDPFR